MPGGESPYSSSQQQGKRHTEESWAEEGSWSSTPATSSGKQTGVGLLQGQRNISNQCMASMQIRAWQVPAVLPILTEHLLPTSTQLNTIKRNLMTQICTWKSQYQSINPLKLGFSWGIFFLHYTWNIKTYISPSFGLWKVWRWCDSYMWYLKRNTKQVSSL